MQTNQLRTLNETMRSSAGGSHGDPPQVGNQSKHQLLFCTWILNIPQHRYDAECSGVTTHDSAPTYICLEQTWQSLQTLFIWISLTNTLEQEFISIMKTKKHSFHGNISLASQTDYGETPTGVISCMVSKCTWPATPSHRHPWQQNYIIASGFMYVRHLVYFLIKCSDKCNLSTSFKIRNLLFIFKHPLPSVNHSFHWPI